MFPPARPGGACLSVPPSRLPSFSSLSATILLLPAEMAQAWVEAVKLIYVGAALHAFGQKVKHVAALTGASRAKDVFRREIAFPNSQSRVCRVASCLRRIRPEQEPQSGRAAPPETRSFVPEASRRPASWASKAKQTISGRTMPFRARPASCTCFPACTPVAHGDPRRLFGNGQEAGKFPVAPSR